MTSAIDQSFFFTPIERENLLKSSRTDVASLTARIFSPVWKLMSARFIPDTVAPNTISLLGAVCAMQSYTILNEYEDSQPQEAALIAMVLLFVNVCCMAVDGHHAMRCRSNTPLGAIFSHICVSLTHLFFDLTLFTLFNVKDIQTLWFVVIGLELLRVTKSFILLNARHMGPIKSGRASRTMDLFQATELSLLEIVLLLIRFWSPLDDWFHISPENARMFYLISVILCLSVAAFVNIPNVRKGGILMGLGARVIPIFLVLPLSKTSTMSIIADAAFVCLLNTEIHLSAFCERPIHSYVVVVAFVSVLNSFLALFLISIYVAGVLVDLSYTTRTPLFQPVRNVYIDGVYDLCHIGHKRLMRNALQHGNRLIVGVLSDEDCVSYKRKPIMTTEERCAEVLACKFVSEVIPGAPSKGLTEEFLREHKIHVVVYGEEYDRPEDHYYAAARKMGIHKVAPRTEGMSTSTLIKRIRAADEDALKAKDKECGSPVKE